jgi:hypothetical protein
MKIILVRKNYYYPLFIVFDDLRINDKKDLIPAVLKLGFALLRVAKYPKGVAKFEKKKISAQNATNKPKIKIFNLVFVHLEGCKIS